MENQTVLIVTNDRTAAAALANQLRELNYVVVGNVLRATEAIALTNQLRPSLVLFDNVLQGEAESFDAAKALCMAMRIPIVFLVGTGATNDVQLGIERALYGFLTIPTRPRELRAAIKFALAKATMEKTRRDADLWLGTTLRCIGDAVIFTDASSNITFVNPVAESLTGWSVEEAIGRPIATVMNLVSSDGTDDVIDVPARQILRSGETVDFLLGTFMQTRIGGRLQIDNSATRIRDDEGELLGSVTIFRDVSLRARYESELRIKLNIVHDAFELAGSGMALVSIDGRFLRVNLAFSTLLGIARADLLTLTQSDLTMPQDWVMEQGLLFQLISGSATAVQFEKRYVRRDSANVIWTLVSVSLMHESGAAMCFLYQIFDVTAKKETEDKLAMMAYRDPLTGLGNRTRIREDFERLLGAARRYNRHIAVCMMDLDRFKLINDTLGHEAGDTVLTTVAKRISATLRETDRVSRLGGDEFVLVLPDTDTVGQISTVMEKLCTTIERPMMTADREVVVTTTIGVALYPGDGQDLQTLMRNADSALYAAKAAGRNRFRMFHPTLEREASARFGIEAALRNGCSRNEFKVHYQPIVRLADGAICGCEALIRWHYEGEFLSPAKFLPLAEETGLIIPIGKRVLEVACRVAAKWPRPLTINVNCSPRQFREDAVTETTRAVLAATGLAPERLCLEITEEAMLVSTDAIQQRFAELAALGVQLAIDDYGSGYSSLAYLKRYAPQTLKIDGFFIRDMLTDVVSMEIIGATIAMAHKLGLKVVAERVESAGQMHSLKQMGCDYAQGYWFSRPVERHRAAALIDNGFLCTDICEAA